MKKTAVSRPDQCRYLLLNLLCHHVCGGDAGTDPDLSAAAVGTCPDPGRYSVHAVSDEGEKAGQVPEYQLVPMMTSTVRIGEDLSASALTRGLGRSVRSGKAMQGYVGIQE